MRSSRHANAPLVVAAGVILLALISGVSSFAAATDPYPQATTGYDLSYPQCGGSIAPGGAFGIIGVNGGKPFTYNRCLSAEYTAAPKSPAPSLYVNTGYDDSYRKKISLNCAFRSVGIAGTAAQQKAWAIGCTEAETSINFAYRLGATNSMAMWWLDVEPDNSWSTIDLTLNQQAIQGSVSRLGQTGLPVGIYSNAKMWAAITGGNYTPSGLAADWVASGSCKTPFTKSPVWLAQSVVGGVDRNFACSL